MVLWAQSLVMCLFNYIITFSSFPTAWNIVIVLLRRQSFVLLAFFLNFRKGLKKSCIIVVLLCFQSGFRTFHSTVEKSGFSIALLLDLSNV
jgi:hypothetical protein